MENKIGSNPHNIKPSEILILPQTISHGLNASVKLKMLLTMYRVKNLM